jgi:YD repeat-containing protein
VERKALFLRSKNVPKIKKVPLKLYQVQDFSEIGIAARLYFTLDKSAGERYTLGSNEITRLRELLNQVWAGRGNAAAANQMMWRERYAYDANGNRASKTTLWEIRSVISNMGGQDNGKKNKLHNFFRNINYVSICGR